MKPRLPFLLLLFIFSSCTKYQYLTVSGVNIAKAENNGFVSETDTLSVQYHFSDYKGRIGIRIQNKLNQPLEIDWKRSAIIVDGKALSYFNPNATIAATMQQDSTRWRSLFAGFSDPVYLASLDGSILIDEPTQFIPPSSFIYKVPLVLPVEPLQNLPEQSATTEKAVWATDVSYNYKKMVFEQGASPLQFRSYLTLRVGSQGAQKEFSLEHRFYISEVWKSAAGPSYFPENLIKRGDRFYLQP
jgi:hypothetical protein